MCRYMNVLLFVLVFGIILHCVPSAPVNVRKKAVSFLFKYGYLNMSNPMHAGGANDENSPILKAAIAKLQRFANLTVTGRLDKKTLNLVKKQRCGISDPVEKLNNTRDALGQLKVGNYYLQGTYWRKKDLTYRFKSFTSDLDRNTQIGILRKMIDKWDKASTLTITEADSRMPDNEVDILISFVTRNHGDPYAFDGSGGTLAHAYYPHNNNGLSGDAHFDDDEHFTTESKGGINLDWVAVHEFGHSMGLEHSNVRESIMYPWYKGYFENIELTSDDIRGIQALYGKPKATPAPPSPTPPSSAPPSPSAPSPTPPEDNPECQSRMRYDAVVMDAGENTHFFKGHYFWTLGRNLREKKFRRVRDCWRNLQTPVDAAYLNTRGNIVFFKGWKYWEYKGTFACRMQLEGSGPISNYNLVSDVANMDVVFTWKKNKKTYFFKGDQYWRYDDNKRALDQGYPRKITRGWVNFPKVIDAAVTWRNGRSYIFSAGNYYKLDKTSKGGKVHVVGGYPRDTAEVWMKCQSKAIGALVSGPSSWP